MDNEKKEFIRNVLTSKTRNKFDYCSEVITVNDINQFKCSVLYQKLLFTLDLKEGQINYWSFQSWFNRQKAKIADAIFEQKTEQKEHSPPPQKRNEKNEIQKENATDNKKVSFEITSPETFKKTGNLLNFNNNEKD